MCQRYTINAALASQSVAADFECFPEVKRMNSEQYISWLTALENSGK